MRPKSTGLGPQSLSKSDCHHNGRDPTGGLAADRCMPGRATRCRWPICSCVRRWWTIARSYPQDPGEKDARGNVTLISGLIRSHFHPTPLDDITISERRFPFRVRADLQRAIDRLFAAETSITHFCGVRKEYAYEGVELSGCLIDSDHNPAVSVPPQYEEVDIGEENRSAASRMACGSSARGEQVCRAAGAGRQFPGCDRHPVSGCHAQQPGRDADHSGVLQASGRVGPQGRVVPGQDPVAGAGGALVLRRVLRHQGPQAAHRRARSGDPAPKTLDLLERNVIQFVRQRPGWLSSGWRRRRGCCSTGRRAPARRTRSTTWPGPSKGTRRC